MSAPQSLLPEFERDKAKAIAILALVRKEIATFEPPVTAHRAFRLENLFQEFADLDLWFKLGFSQPAFRFYDQSSETQKWRMMMFTPIRNIGIGMLPLVGREDPAFTELSFGLQRAAELGWRGVSITIDALFDELGLLIDLPARRHRRPLIGDLDLRLSDDALVRMLLNMRAQVELNRDGLRDRMGLERVLKERQLTALLAHCFPGFGPPFELVTSVKEFVATTVLLACSPSHVRPSIIPIDEHATASEVAERHHVLLRIVDNLLICRAAALGVAFDPVCVVSTAPPEQIPEPTPENIGAALEMLKQPDDSARYSMEDYSELLGIGKRWAADMMRSADYVASPDVKSIKPYQLRHQAVPRTQDETGRFQSAVRWTWAEVIAAIRGWAVRLGMPEDRPF